MALEFSIRKLSKEISRRQASNARALEKRQDQEEYKDTIDAFKKAIKAMELTQFVQKDAKVSAKNMLLAKRAVKKVIMLAEAKLDESHVKVLSPSSRPPRRRGPGAWTSTAASSS